MVGQNTQYGPWTEKYGDPCSSLGAEQETIADPQSSWFDPFDIQCSVPSTAKGLQKVLTLQPRGYKSIINWGGGRENLIKLIQATELDFPWNNIDADVGHTVHLMQTTICRVWYEMAFPTHQWGYHYISIYSKNYLGGFNDLMLCPVIGASVVLKLLWWS